MNRAAHEELHTDPRELRYTSASDTIEDAEESLRMPFRRQRHLASIWWGVEGADSSNDIDLEVILDAVIILNVTLTQGNTESQVGLIDAYTTEGSVLTLRISGTIDDVVGPWWAEIDMEEAFV